MNDDNADVTTNMAERARAAVDAVDLDADWLLEPEKHAELLPATAGALKRVLRRRTLETIIARYSSSDRRAIDAQKRYKRSGEIAIVAGAVALIAGGIALYSATDSQQSNLHYLFLVIEALAVTIGAFYVYMLKNGDPYGEWMRQRSRAETARIEFFNNVCMVSDEQPQSGEVALAPLQLEYFRRFHLDVQLRYYRERPAEYERVSRKFLVWGGAIAALTILATTMAASFGSVVVVSVLAALIMLAVPAIAGAHENLQLLHEGKRNVIRYRNTCDTLEGIAANLDATMTAVENNDRSSLHTFMAQVNECVSIEHKEWLTLQEQAENLNFPGMAGDS